MNRTFSAKAVLSLVTHTMLCDDGGTEMKELIRYLNNTNSTELSDHGYAFLRAADIARAKLLQQYPKLPYLEDSNALFSIQA